MARVLLGVTGGIAAYKALELTRLATKAGHSVRVIQTEASTRFVGTASFAAITGAPVLVTEWEPDPLRGAFPGDPAPEHAPLSHLALVERADLYVIAPASANTIAKLAGGHADNLLTAAALACRRAAARRAGHERCDVRASGDAREPRHAARPRGRGARARHRRARLAGGVGRRPPARAGRAAGRHRGAPRRRRRAARRRCRSSSPPAARASRSTPSASSATAAPGRWAGRSPRRPRAAARKVTVVAANVGAAARARHRVRRRHHRRRARRRLPRALPGRRRPADGRRRRRLPPGRRRAPTRSRRPTRGRPSRSSSSRPRTS